MAYAHLADYPAEGRGWDEDGNGTLRGSDTAYGTGWETPAAGQVIDDTGHRSPAEQRDVLLAVAPADREQHTDWRDIAAVSLG